MGRAKAAHDRKGCGRSESDSRSVFTVQEVAKLLGIGRISAYQAVERGDVPAVRLGRRIVIPKAAFYLKFGNNSG